MHFWRERTAQFYISSPTIHWSPLDNDENFILQCNFHFEGCENMCEKEISKMFYKDCLPYNKYIKSFEEQSMSKCHNWFCDRLILSGSDSDFDADAQDIWGIKELSWLQDSST